MFSRNRPSRMPLPRSTRSCDNLRLPLACSKGLNHAVPGGPSETYSRYAAAMPEQRAPIPWGWVTADGRFSAAC